MKKIYVIICCLLAINAFAQTADPALLLQTMQNLSSSEIEQAKILLAQQENKTAPNVSAISNPSIIQEKDRNIVPRQTSNIVVSHENITTEKDSLKNDVFGHDYFLNNELGQFEKYYYGQTPDNYILDDGDELNISIWGSSELNTLFKIQPEGYIQPNNIGRIYLKGLTFKEGTELLTKRFANVYDLQNSKIAIRLNTSRNIKVNIVGQVNKPGTYSMPAINSAFNALMAASGISKIGSLRDIQIKRDGKIVKTLDLYDFLLNPKKYEDVFLRDNDYLVVPTYIKWVKIRGEVKRPMTYELKDGESLTELIDYAGGFKPNAFTTSLRYEHFVNNQYSISDINYAEMTKLKSKFYLNDGDEVLVRSLEYNIKNKVRLLGAVRVPNDYEINENTKVADVIKRAGGVLYSSYLPKAYIVRYTNEFEREYLSFNVDSVLNFPHIGSNYILKPLDYVQIYSKNKFVDSATVVIYGAVRAPGKFTYGDKLTLKDLLLFAGGLRPEAAGNKIEISRIYNSTNINSGDVSKVKIKVVTINSDLSIDKESEITQLNPFDEIFVRQNPDFELQKDVVLTGEVKYPGIYTLLSKNERMLDVINRAGGLLPSSFHNGVTIKRKESKLGFLVVDLDKALRRPRSQFNYFLREGDSISIPKIRELVTVKGAVQFSGIDTNQQVNVPFFYGKRAGYYIKNFVGGFDRDAFKRKTIVIDANGRIRSTRKFLGLINRYPRVEMGATIQVPRRIEKKVENNNIPIDWNRAIETTTVKITAVLTVLILASRAFDYLTTK